jgi:hypothetical protein
MSDPPPAKTLGFSPFSGCAMFLIMVLGIIFLIGIVIYVGFSQEKAIASFTEDAPKLVPLLPVDEAQKVALQKKLTEFYTALEQGKIDEKLTLSLDELNQWVTIGEPFKEWQGMLRWTKTDLNTQCLIAEVAWKFNGLPIIGHPHYMNGLVHAKISVEADNIDPAKRLQVRVIKMEVPNKEVPIGLTQGLAQHDWLYPYFGDKKMGPILHRIIGTQVQEKSVTFISGEAIVPSAKP